ncbi:SWIM zinc finger family protein [Sorangium sp. So ce233]|uniref:SWIM zinc finger family protein n=1 Tax=Sorangium sp. So ce233 TaxID=3133290 RepID=UPI003F5F1478
MSSPARWAPFRREAGPKPPPPARGIRMKRAGTTWWGKRWVEALERMAPDEVGRLARGRTYARAGRTHDLTVKPGLVVARVTGSQPKPYKVILTLARLDDATWAKAIAAMAKRAKFAADLLAGRMPEDIDEAFRSAGASLFPEKPEDLTTACSCPDWVNPCKHVAATHYVLGEALDKDPFLLFELRGRTRAQVIEALRAARAGAAPGKRTGAGKAVPCDKDAPPIATVTLGKMAASDFDAWREPPPALDVALDPPAAHAALLTQLGEPPGWREERSPAELLGPLIRAASERAREIAMAEGAPPQRTPPCAGNAPGSSVTIARRARLQ